MVNHQGKEKAMPRMKRIADPITSISDFRVRFSEKYRTDIPARPWLDPEWIPFKDFLVEKASPTDIDLNRALIQTSMRERSKWSSLTERAALAASKDYLFTLVDFRRKDLGQMGELPGPIMQMEQEEYHPIFAAIWDGELVLFTRLTKLIGRYKPRLYVVGLQFRGEEVARRSVLPEKEEHVENVRRIRIRRK